MKKINAYSTQFKIISEHQYHPNHENMSANQDHPNEYHENHNPKSKKKLSKQNQEFMNNIAASGFKYFHV